MELLSWAVPVVLAFVGGIFFLRFLTVHPLKMSLYLALTLLAVFGVLTVFLAGWAAPPAWAAALLSFAVFLAGYALSTRRFLAREDDRPVPELRRTKGDRGLGHTAVIYFTHGEPETYDPIGWLNQFREFDQQKIQFVPLLARPFFVNSLRNHYLAVGKSNHRRVHQQMLNCLEARFRARGDATTRFYLCFLDDKPRPDAAVIQALNDGASRLVVSEIFLTISNHTAEGKHLIEALHVEDYGVELCFTGPLWDSKALRGMFVQRAKSCLNGTPREKVGVMLVGHGQPDEWDEEWPTETEQELDFRKGVLCEFERDGYPAQNLSLAWMEFKDPRPKHVMAEYARNGVEKVLYFAAAISADSLHSQYDIPAMIQATEAAKRLETINLGAWNDDPLVILAIQEKLLRVMG